MREISIWHWKCRHTETAFDPVSNFDAIEQIHTPSNLVSSGVTVLKPNKLKIWGLGLSLYKCEHCPMRWGHMIRKLLRFGDSNYWQMSSKRQDSPVLSQERSCNVIYPNLHPRCLSVLLIGCMSLWLFWSMLHNIGISFTKNKKENATLTPGVDGFWALSYIKSIDLCNLSPFQVKG